MHPKSYPRYYGSPWWQDIYPTATADFESFTPFDIVALDPAAEVEYLSTKDYADSTLDAEQQIEIGNKIAESIYKSEKYATMSTEKLVDAEILVSSYMESQSVLHSYFLAVFEYPAGHVLQRESDEKAEVAFYVEVYMWQGLLALIKGELKRRKNQSTAIVVGVSVVAALIAIPQIISLVKSFREK